jgi:hypothetical protein
MYDDTCRFLAENFSADFASWLLGESIPLTELKPSELLLEPIRADALILLESDESVLHLEFQTRPKRDIPFRMLDYRVRVYRRYRPIRQPDFRPHDPSQPNGCISDFSWTKIGRGGYLSSVAEGHYARVSDLSFYPRRGRN